MMVLWLLILRGTSIEFRNHIKSPIWIPFWDFFFSISSLLLAIFFGAALANVVRGVPLDQSGYFFRDLSGQTSASANKPASSIGTPFSSASWRCSSS